MLSLSLEEQIAGRCVHFTGIQNKICKAGIGYASFPRGTMPCMGDENRGPCAKLHFPTPEEVATEIDRINESRNRTGIAIAAVCSDAKASGLKKGRGGGRDIPCPVCKTGLLRYQVASCNGHIHAQCQTPGCVSWMQ